MIAKNIEETREYARSVLNTLKQDKNTTSATIVGLEGDLGSGKTAFVKEVADILGIKDTVKSPTFILMQVFRIPDTTVPFENLVHIDAYRLEKGESTEGLGTEALFSNPKNLIFIEWPENMADTLPQDIMKIYFTFVDENTREIKANFL